MEELSFEASERSGQRVVLDAHDVEKAAGSLATKSDLSKFLL